MHGQQGLSGLSGGAEALRRGADAEKGGLIRVIDESGEDYLYPKARFRSADDLKPSVKRAVLAAPASAMT
jgi:hypothetical protein